MCCWHRWRVAVRVSVGCERGVPLLVSEGEQLAITFDLVTPAIASAVAAQPTSTLWDWTVPQTSTRPAQHHGQPGTTPVLTINLSEAIQMSNPPGYDVHHVTKRRSSRCMRCAGSFCCCSGRRQRGGRNRTWYTVQSRSEPQPPGRQRWDARHTAIEMCCLHSTQ